MVIRAVMLDETWEYVSKFDTAEGEERTIWELGVVDAALLATIEDNMLTYRVDVNAAERGEEDAPAETKLAIKQRNIEVLRHGLRGVRNFVDAAGKDVPFRTVSAVRNGRNVKLVDNSTIRSIPARVVNELAEQILAGNSVTEDEVKN